MKVVHSFHTTKDDLMETDSIHLGQYKRIETCSNTQQQKQQLMTPCWLIFVNMMKHQHIYEIPSQDSARETVAVEMNNFSESDNGGVSPEGRLCKGKI